MNRSRFGIIKYNTKKVKHKELKKAFKNEEKKMEQNMNMNQNF